LLYIWANAVYEQKGICILIEDHFCLQNSPNDLQMMSDAPAHHLFCLLGPVDPNQKHLPEVLVVIQVWD
jgi:N-acetyltransferase 10